MAATSQPRLKITYATLRNDNEQLHANYDAGLATARGELGVYIVSDGNSKPYRVKFRAPSFSNLGALQPITIGSKIGDLMASMATIDLVIPDIDR